MKLTLTLQLELDPHQLSPTLAQQLANVVACVNRPEPAPEPETEPQPLPAAGSAPKRRKGRPRKPDAPVVVSPDAWPTFDELVRSEMERLAEHDRMPDHRLWNNERDVRLPTMAQIFSAYGVQNILQLANRLEMRPPLSALGVSPYPQADEALGREVDDA